MFATACNSSMLNLFGLAIFQCYFVDTFLQAVSLTPRMGWGGGGGVCQNCGKNC